MRESRLLSAMVIGAAASSASAHIEDFEVEVADWFVTGATPVPGADAHIDADGAGGVLTASGLLGPLVDDGDGSIVQFVLEGHIHGEIEQGQVFRVDYAFDPVAAGGSFSMLGGQMTVEAVLDDGSLFGLGALPASSPFSGFFHTSALELLGGPLIANHGANQADFVLAINFGWTGAAPDETLSLSGGVTVTPVPAPVGGAAWLAAGVLAASRRKR